MQPKRMFMAKQEIYCCLDRTNNNKEQPKRSKAVYFALIFCGFWSLEFHSRKHHIQIASQLLIAGPCKYYFFFGWHDVVFSK